MFSITAQPSTRPRIARVAVAVATVAVVAALLGGVQSAAAQSASELPASQATGVSEHTPRWDFYVASGTLIPTGAQRGDIKRANLTAAQLLYVVRPDLAVTATLGWARSRDGTDQQLDIYTYDVGVETRPARWMVGKSTIVTPFAGIGLGARSYNVRNSDLDATHRLAAYVSAGGDVAIGRVNLRLEVRDYLTGSGGQGSGGARNDVVAMVGLYFTGQ